MSSLPDGEVNSQLPIQQASNSVDLFCGNQVNIESLVQKYRPYLKSLAAKQMPMHLQSRLDDSDLVQEVMLRATKDLSQFRGTTEQELEAWLREVLSNCIADCVRFNGRQMRDVRVEQSFPENGIAGFDPTPSENVRKSESDDRVWQAVYRLSNDYQTVIHLRQQLGLSFVEIGLRMQRSPDAARMLWSRALVALGEQLDGAQ